MSDNLPEEKESKKIEEKIRLEKIKRFFQTIWNWVKSNWFVVLICLVVLFVFAAAWKGCETDNAYQTLFNQYQESIDDHQNQLNELQKIQKEERKQREQQFRKFMREMQRIEKEYKNELKRIENKKRTKQNEIIREAEENPETLTKRIEDTFGIPHEE